MGNMWLSFLRLQLRNFWQEMSLKMMMAESIETHVIIILVNALIYHNFVFRHMFTVRYEISYMYFIRMYFPNWPWPWISQTGNLAIQNLLIQKCFCGLYVILFDICTILYFMMTIKVSHHTNKSIVFHFCKYLFFRLTKLKKIDT